MLRYVIFNSKLSQFLVLSTISVFNYLTLALISDPHPTPSSPDPYHPIPYHPLADLCTVLVNIPWAGLPGLIKFHLIDKNVLGV